MGEPDENKHLSDVERKLLEAVVKANYNGVQELLRENKIKNIDFVDDTGMTLLQHAAFRGKKNLCELFLSHGADVNSNAHENGYTTLMFAALSGNTEVTKLVLDRGAKTDSVNSVGRTASQMAAFVGQHQCVAVINSFFKRSDLDHYCKPQGQEKEPKLQADTAYSLCQMLNIFNLNPVKLAMFLQDHSCLLDKSKNVIKVLELMCEKYMKARDTNDSMAMKTFYYSVLIREATKYCTEEHKLEKYIKMLVKKRESDSVQLAQEALIRMVVAEFPYGDSQLFQQLQGNLKRGNKVGDPSGLHLLVQGINGQKFAFDDDNDCASCGTTSPDNKKCKSCHSVSYCNKECQRLDWSHHKKECSKLLEQYNRVEKEKQKEKEKLEKEKQQKEDTTKKMEDMKMTENEVKPEPTPETSNGVAESSDSSKTEPQTNSTTAAS